MGGGPVISFRFPAVFKILERESMYVPSDQACSGPTGKTPPSAQSVAQDRAVKAAIQQQVNAGNIASRNLVDRDWQDFSSMGPQVAWQVLNQSAPVYDATIIPQVGQVATGGGSIVGVNVGGGDPTSGGTQSKLWVPPKRRKSGRTGTATPQDQANFAAAFGGGQNLTPWKVYTGPLPATGTSMSQVYGGSPSNRSPVFGTDPAQTPNAAAGYFQSSCPSPVGVNAIPFGEPDYGSGSGSSSTTSVTNGAAWAIAAVLGLAALSWLTDKHTERKSRKAAQ